MSLGTFQENTPQLFNQGLFEVSSTQKHRLGTPRRLEDGRTFIYAKNGGTALAAGKLTVAPTVVANHVNKSVGDAAAIGDRAVKVDLGSTALTANQYKEGFLVINDATGEGHQYKVSGHAAADADATDVKINLYDAVRAALVANTSEYSLLKHPYDSVVISATDQGDTPTGIPSMAVTADYYFWLQTWGVCPALADETLAVGQALTIGTGVAGAVEVMDLVGEPLVGYAIQAGVDTEYRQIFLTIQP
ncbi:MAG: hypothetical protein OCU18_03940 [Candidatus Syntrophoarchaeum sp.]|nr:hypothetical protein [Candidatus Syntrophoarchaeum sp.]